jgi:benzoyl-CoA reductase/2-hydroxyglutaryl-CoA dehydratase subunit BcrC/BadD/HgdB
MKAVIYTCSYVPAEWIAAHGLRASRLLLDRADPAFSAARTEGVCPYVRCFICAAMKETQASGIVMTTVCDQMRRAFDILVRSCDVPTFLMNVPNTWQSLASQRLYRDELKRLGLFLIRADGQSPPDHVLAETMLRYDDARRSIRAARPYLSARRYAEVMAEFGSNGPSEILGDIKASAPLTGSVPLAVVGGPLMRPDFELFDLIEQSGGRIVLDATETGERGLCVAFDRRRLRDEPLMELADAYFGSIPDASRRPNSDLYMWLKRGLSGRGVRGIIFHRYLWCDMWHAELGRLRDWTNLPVLDIDTAGDNETDHHRTANRIRAFLEMLQ